MRKIVTMGTEQHVFLHCRTGVLGNNVIVFSASTVFQNWFPLAVLPNDKIIPATVKNIVYTGLDLHAKCSEFLPDFNHVYSSQNGFS